MPRCVGRRYPEAEVRTKGGCLERPPPLRFQIRMTSFVGTWAIYGDVWLDLDIDMIGTGVQGPWDQFTRWRRVLVAGKVIDLHLIVVAGTWRLQVLFTQGFPGGGIATRFHEQTFAAGFPRWGPTLDIIVVAVSPNWLFSGGNFCEVRPATYQFLPPGYCTP